MWKSEESDSFHSFECKRSFGCKGSHALVPFSTWPAPKDDDYCDVCDEEECDHLPLSSPVLAQSKVNGKGTAIPRCQAMGDLTTLYAHTGVSSS